MNNVGMDVEADSRYFSLEDLFDHRTSTLSGFVTSYAKLENLIDQYEYATSSRFCTVKSSKHFGKKTDISFRKKLQFFDTQKNSQPHIDFDGIPFFILGKKIMECHQGPDRDRKTNERKLQKYTEHSDHTYKRKRRRVQTSKKKGCPAKLKIRHVVKIPGYQVAEDASKYSINKAIAQVKEGILKNIIPGNRFEHRFYVQFPEVEDHFNHLKGEASSTLQPMDKQLSEYIKRVVGEHRVTSTLKMKLLLEVFVKESLFKNTAFPPKHNKRFWPSLKDIYNHMATQMLKLRDSCLDQQVIQEMVKREKSSHPSDKFYIRTKNENESESIIEEPDENFLLDEDFTIRHKPGCRNKFLYVHQTKWQQQLLRRYGNEICLLDATYRTTRYSLPLYFLCVPTNVNYVTVATFIVESEDTPSIQEALSVIKAWNLEWRPSYFMCDYANEEINAVESVFPESFVYLCDFHREQAWERWLKASHNGIGDAKSNILYLFRSIAHSKTVEEYEMAKASLEESKFWRENSRLRKWFKERWLDKHKRWVQAFRQMRFNASVNTNNGVERQNKSLKYEYLETKKAKSLSHLLTILWNEFLPDLYQRYARQNLSSAEEARNYNENIPSFLRNRPASVVKHCYRRWEDSINIPAEDIDEIGEGQFLVRSQAPGSSQVYTVNFSPGQFPIPSCSCEDWRKFHLICKHFCAIFRLTSWKWEQLPLQYRNNPFITLDDDVLHHFSSAPAEEDVCTSSHEIDEESEPVEESQPLPVPNKSRLSKLRSNIGSICEVIKDYVYSCKDEDLLQCLCTNLQNTSEDLRNSLCNRNELVVDDPENDMIHIGTCAKKIRRLSLPKKKRKGIGRHGLSAERMRTHTSKGIGDLLNEESGEGTVVEEVITIDDEQCVLDTAIRSILKKGTSKSSVKKRVHFCNDQQGDSPQDISSQDDRSNGISKTKVAVTVPHSNDTLCTDGKESRSPVELLWSLDKDFYIPVAKVCDKLVMDADIRSLRDNECLTDRVLDCYLSHLVTMHNGLERKVIYYDQTKMTDIINRSYQIHEVSDSCNSDLEADVILGIYYRSHHWTLVIVEVKKGIVYFYNPCGERKMEMQKILSSWRKYEKDYRGKFHVPRKASEWRISSTPHTNQKDAFNCGIFCLMFADKHLAGDVDCLLTITSADLQHMRRFVASTLMQGKIFLKGCCPKCAKNIDDGESIKCCTCRRFFHFKPFCIEEDLADMKGAEKFNCRLCRINFWTQKEGHYDLRKHPLKISKKKKNSKQG